MKRLSSISLFLVLAFNASAHFLFVVPDAGKASAKVFINEQLKPGDVGIDMISGAKLILRGADGKETPLTMQRGENAFTISIPGDGTRLVYGMADLGLNERGGKPNLLLYYPKTIVGDAFDAKLAPTGAPVELFPTGGPGAWKLKLVGRGKALPNSEITLILPDGSEKKIKTDANGETPAYSETGRFGAWARFFEPLSGERGGKKYDETRHYATLVFDSGEPATSAMRFATMPQAASSFGAAVSGDWLYVYGGHIAPTHNYSTESVSGRFDRLKLSDHETWEQLPAGPPLQGMNLAVHKGKIYRIGGMAPHNKPGTAAENISTAECGVFDPATKQWTPLPALAEPRSSHDVVVIGDQLFVTGGWNLKGKDGQQWLDTVAILDLAAKNPQWRTVAQPFKRRALIATAHAGKMYVIGGFDDHSKVVQEVSIFDPKTGSWTKGADLPGSGTNAFAPAAAVHHGVLYASLGDGGLYRLDEAGGKWLKSGAASPRVAHRIASDGKEILVIGGAGKGGNSNSIESVTPIH